jgi:hypothetical protein
MNLFRLCLIRKIIFLVMSVSISSAYADEIKLSEYQKSRTGLMYWMVKKLVNDVDKSMISKGLEADSCIYRSHVTGKDVAYKGLGPCLYLNFQESLKTDKVSGVIYFWLKGIDTKVSPIEIHWRPPHGGIKTIISEIVEMKLEKQLYAFRKLMGENQIAEDIHFKEFIGGDWDIIFPDDPLVMEMLAQKGNSWTSSYLKNLREINIHLEPTQREDGVVVHNGQITVDLDDDSSAKIKSTVFHIKTNINVLVASRKFYIKVKNEDMGNSVLDSAKVSNVP